MKNLSRTKINRKLGIWEMETINNALVVKLGWTFIKNPDDRLVKLLEAKYLTMLSFCETKQPKSTTSSWKTIMSRRDLLKEGICWAIASGHNIYIWDDPWVPSLPYFRITENTIESPKKVTDLIDQSTTVGGWIS